MNINQSRFVDMHFDLLNAKFEEMRMTDPYLSWHKFKKWEFARFKKDPANYKVYEH